MSITVTRYVCTYISLSPASPGNLLDDEVALDWLTTQATSESVEEVTPIVLSKLVGDARRLAVLFCEYGMRTLI